MNVLQLVECLQRCPEDLVVLIYAEDDCEHKDVVAVRVTKRGFVELVYGEATDGDPQPSSSDGQ